MEKDWLTKTSGVLKHVLEESTSASRPDPTRVGYLRVSSFPFCARKWYLSLPTSTTKVLHTDLAGQFFLRIGTTAHEVLQEAIAATALPQKAVLVQDWVCRECNERHVFQPKPDACSFCGNTNLAHAETRLTYGKFTRGHMDGCIAFPDASGSAYGKHWFHVPIDYKTTTLSAVTAQDSKLPYESNVEQLGAYTAILVSRGYNCPGHVLIYVPRDNPHAYRMFYTPHDAGALQRIDRYEREYGYARNAVTITAARAIPPVVTEGFSRSPRCSYCIFQSACTAAQDDETLLDTMYKASIQALKRLHSPKDSM